jgi:hypothetical protein
MKANCGQDVAAACGNTGILELFKRDAGVAAAPVAG